MNPSAIKSLVILGGGSAGWMAAALFAKRFSLQHLQITLIESSDIGAIGVGEATVPVIKNFLSELEIPEQDFIRETQATFKLGIDFIDWHKPGTRFFHPFAPLGAKIAKIPFHHYWATLKKNNQVGPIDDFSLAAQMARRNKFFLPKPEAQTLDIAQFNYAYHFDAGLFANLLRKHAIASGVVRKDAKVTHIQQCESSGFIKALELDTGETVAGDFFIDCSGFKGLLIEQTLQTGYTSWQQWLKCDSAIAIQTALEGTPEPYTKSIAMSSGWRWQIPLQHRQGNGYVYSSEFLSHAQATDELLAALKTPTLTPPKLISFTPGTRKKTWNKNVFALGLASGFLEPLESTSIYMIQACLDIFYFHFPANNQFEKLAERANQLVMSIQEKLRDFVILHYCLNQRTGQDFWDSCRQMSLPASLQDRIDEYQQTANLRLDEQDFFKMNSWVSLFSGFDLLPDYLHPKLREFSEQSIAKELHNMESSIQQLLPRLPSQDHFLNLCNNPDFTRHKQAAQG